MIENKGILSKFNDNFSYKDKDLEKVEFSKGFIDKPYYIATLLFGHGGHNGNNKADQIVITTKNKVTIIFHRFGERKSFEKTIDLVNNKL